MNQKTIIAAIAVILLVPVLFLIINSFEGEPVRNFHGKTVTEIDPADGLTVVATEAENKKGVPLRAQFNAAFVEKITGKRPPHSNGLDLTINLPSRKIQECDANSAVPPLAGLDLTNLCAPFAFQNSKDPKKTALYIAPEEFLFVFGSVGKNQVRLFHHDMVATYTSPDMTQSDRKHEACIVRIMMDYLINPKLAALQDCTPNK